MADQRLITLYEVSATPTDVVLRALPVADAATPSVCFLYPVAAPLPPSGSDPRIITLYEVAPTPTDIVLRALPNWTLAPPSADIILRGLLTPETPPAAPPEEPPGEYYAILKRWTGAAWVKAQLKVYTGGSFQAATLKVWVAGEWKSVDTTGV